MPVFLIVGSQWGDEGKGKIVDMISRGADVVARYQGGANAGHTVVIGENKYILHLVPSGILHPNCQCLLGNGMVVDPKALIEEIRSLEKTGLDVKSRLLISDCAHMILPYQRLLDTALEKQRGKNKIGTTGRGIGCAHADKAHRCGLRLGDLRDERIIRAKIASLEAFYRPLFEKVHQVEVPDANQVVTDLLEYAGILTPMLVDGPVWINQQLDDNRKVLIEGAQGALLDIDHGTYPYVTSSNPTTGGVCTGLGISPKRINRIAGVAKAYTTRVGEGPMPTEFAPEFAEKVRKEGNEYGATTGRPRRCGWFDAPAVRRSILVGGIEEIMLTKLDVLDPLEKVRIGTRYRIDGEEMDILPTNLTPETPVEVVYEDMPGWQKSTRDCRCWEDLPPEAKNYILKLQRLTRVPISIISVGPERDATIALSQALLW